MTTHLFDHLVTRHAGLPVESVDQLVCHDLVSCLREFDKEQQQLRDAADRLETALFDAVPRATSKELRRRVLNLKRDVHNLRCGDIQAFSAELIELGMPASVLAEWDAVCRSVRATEQSLVDKLKEATVASRDAALSALGQHVVLRTLALASPSFVEELISVRASGPQAPSLKGSTLARLDRTATSYLSRAALKTSPFGELGVVGQGAFGSETTDELDVTSHLSTVLSNRALATDLVRAVARRADGAPRFEYEINPSLFNADGDTIATLPLRLDDFMWTQDVVTDVGTLRPLLQHLQPGEVVSYETLVERLDEVGGFDAFQRLIDLHLVAPVAPWQRWSRDPLQDLAEYLADRDDTCSRAVGAVAEAHAAASSPMLHVRLGGMRQLRPTTEQAYDSIEAPVPGWLSGVDVLHEDAVVGDTRLTLGPNVKSDLRALGDYVASTVFQTALYADLVEAFVAEHGTGGTCDEPLAFASSFIRRPESGAVFHAAMGRDAAAMAERHRRPPTSRPPLPPGAVVFFQIAAEHRDDVERGDYSLVVNQLSPGLGGILARWCPSLDESGAPASEALRSWFESAAVGARPVTIPLSADWNSLHHRSASLLESFRWPSETPSQGPQGLDLRDLRLYHDADHNTVRFRLDNGPDLAPVYLGTVPMHMVFGPARILYTLADPWIVPDPAGAVLEMFGPKERVRNVVHQARISSGRIVFRRARWIVPTKALPVQEVGENDLRYARRVHAFWDEHQLPDEVYLAAETSGIESEAKFRKPVWVHRSSLRSLQAAASVIAGAHLGVRIIEALPARRQHWIRNAEGRFATEFITLLRWETPQ